MINKITAISWIINSACNLECKHCYPGSGPGKEEELALSAGDIEKMAMSIRSLNPRLVIISGGEPFLSKNLFTFLKYAGEAASDELWLCTNGMFITEDSADKLKELNVRGVSLSLCHPDSEKEDEFRGGKGIHARVARAVELLRSRQIKLTLDFTVTKHNSDSIGKLIDRGVELGVDVIMFKRFRRIGRGQNNGWLELSAEETDAVLKEIHTHAAALPESSIKVDDPLYALKIMGGRHKEGIPHYMRTGVPEQTSIIPALNSCSPVLTGYGKDFMRYWGCKAGVEWVGIDPEGNVSPCPLLGYAGVQIGNIRQGTLAEIVNASSVIKKLRGEVSAGCHYHPVCGGCRAQAQAVYGDYLAKDPQCLRSGQCYIRE